MDSLQGHFLVASPHLPDPNFYRSVVLIIRHDEEGAYGVVLNRPTENTISEIWEMLSDETCNNQQRINLGGPVAGPLLAIHGHESYSEGLILPGVHMAQHKDLLAKIIEDDREPYRIFSGYSGWGPGQLEDELESGGWLTAVAGKSEIFEPDTAELWEQVSRDIGMGIMAPVLRGRALPPEPGLN